MAPTRIAALHQRFLNSNLFSWMAVLRDGMADPSVTVSNGFQHHGAVRVSSRIRSRKSVLWHLLSSLHTHNMVTVSR
jgi:hypothetical protein